MSEDTYCGIPIRVDPNMDEGAFRVVAAPRKRLLDAFTVLDRLWFDDEERMTPEQHKALGIVLNHIDNGPR